MVVEAPLPAFAAERPSAALRYLFCCGEVSPPCRRGLVGGSLSRAALLPPGSAALLNVHVAEPGPDGVNLPLHLTDLL